MQIEVQIAGLVLIGRVFIHRTSKRLYRRTTHLTLNPFSVEGTTGTVCTETMSAKLAFIVSTLRPCGPTNQLYYILEHLDRERFSPSIVTLSPEPPSTAREDFERLDVEYHSLGLSRTDGFVYGPSLLRSTVDALDPDVVHSQGIRADVLSSVFLGEYPRVTTVRNYPYDDYRKFGRLRGWLLARLHLLAYPRIDCRIACSETIAKRLARLSVRTYPIQNGVDQTEYAPTTDERRAASRARLDLPKDGPVIVFSGSLIPRKDPLTLIRGFTSSETAATGTLVVLGDGKLRHRCEELTDENRNVRIEGYVDNVLEYLHSADYFVSASTSEGLPNAVMEALATGVPVCLSDIQPHREILRYDPRAGAIFETRDPDDLAETLDSLVDSTGENRRERARRIVEEELSAARMSREYQSVYERLARGETR